MTHAVLRHRSVWLLVALLLLVGACDILLGLETPQAAIDAAAIDAPSTVDAPAADAVSAAPDAASDIVDAADVVDAVPPPPPDASGPDACVPGQLVCFNGGIRDTCTGETSICPDGRCCNRGEGIVHCLNPGEVCNN
jgi:hypothetical protein